MSHSQVELYAYNQAVLPSTRPDQEQVEKLEVNQCAGTSTTCISIKSTPCVKELLKQTKKEKPTILKSSGTSNSATLRNTVTKTVIAKETLTERLIFTSLQTQTSAYLGKK